MGDIYLNLLEKIKINRFTSIYWYCNGDADEYQVKVMLYNREVYNKRLDKKHFLIYYNFINERVKFLIKGEILHKEYSMILLDGMMYRTLDNGFSHFKEFTRILEPIGDDIYDDIPKRFDLIIDSTLRTGEVYDKEDLVYHNGVFYHDGNIIGSIKDFERDGVEYEKFDLLQGINEEQLKYLGVYNKKFIKNYATRDTYVNIDRW